uniref:NTPase, KAP family P-loop domain containing 1 n=1 Tax=Maylandia zebra TaxID=106582 RepID=A0A3P9B313_9CICH
MLFLFNFLDDIYAYALSKTLTKVSSPLTVGLYASCENRINMILKQMQGRFEYAKGSRPRSVKPSFTGFFALIGRLLFYRPIWTKENQQERNVRFIYVHFSAWHFAGSDLLWAGIAIRLIEAMQMNFGKLQLLLYRVAQHDEEEEVKNKIVEDGPNHWSSKKICCCPLWLFLLSLLVVPLIILIILLTVGFPKFGLKPDEEVDDSNGQVGVLEGLAIATLGVPAVSILKFIILMGKNFIFSQTLNIKRGMDNERLSGQLGFMNEVRMEMWCLSRFIQFMEVFERRRIRIVLNITNLDRCSPKKIVAVLDAMNILLSDEESPFISILAVNPEVLVEKVNFADGCLSKEDKAYALLNSIVTLPFTVPPLSNDSKRSLLYRLSSKSKIQEDSPTVEVKHRGIPYSYDSSNSSLEKVTSEAKEMYPLINTKAAMLDIKDELDNLIRSILSSNDRNLSKYMLDDVMSMRRVINSIRVTVIIMKALNLELPQPEYIAAWVILANHWPCRLSWILQCVEDAQQRADIDGEAGPSDYDSKTLWQVFSVSQAELYVMSGQIEDFLEQDGDAELFENLLKVDFQFKVKDLKTFEAATVNLDHSIKNELAHIRGTSRLKDSGWMRNLAPLPITKIINMNTEDVCKELERMRYPSKYIDIVKSNDLNGSALVFGDVEDLKDLLQMTFGEWATFRLHFLGFPSHLRPQYKNMATIPSHSKNHNSIAFHSLSHSGSLWWCKKHLKCYWII